ncbi:MAG: hypothetical protein QXL43_01100 [Methanolinea sp.]
MIPVPASTFLFCESLCRERMEWLAGVIGAAGTGALSQDGGWSLKFFLTGDALYSLADARTRPVWVTLSRMPSLEVIVDADELRLHGLHGSISPGAGEVRVSCPDGRFPFWGALVSTLENEWAGTRGAAFLLCYPPYMSRVPVYMLRFLSRAVDAGLNPELYCYLDGVHVLHDGQCPSEFENIGKGVSALSAQTVQSCRDPWFSACSRCATARGYYQPNPGTGFCEPASCIQEIEIRPLNKILSRFSAFHPIVSHMAGWTVSPGCGGEGVPRLTVFITHTPYCSEWTFGGLSLAIAAAMEGIETTVIFIEDGVCALHGTHEVPDGGRLFNVQEMIAATNDIPALSYFVHLPSARERGVSTACSGVREITNEALAGILFPRDASNSKGPAMRVLFF